MSESNEPRSPENNDTAAIPVFRRSDVISFFRIIFYCLAIAGGLFLLYRIRDLIPPLAIALTVALTMAPEIDRMERNGWRRGLAIMVIYLAFFGGFTVFIMLMVPLISSQLGNVATQLLHLTIPVNGHSALPGTVQSFMAKHKWPGMLQGPAMQQVYRVPQMLSSYLNSLSQNLPVWAGNLLWVILIPVISFYLLIDYHKIVGKTLLFVKPHRRVALLKIVNDVVAVFGNYVRGVVIIMVLDIIVTYSVLKVLRVPYAETVAVLAGVLYAIPYLGAIVSTILVGLVASIHGLTALVTALVVMVVIHQIIFDQVLAPRIIGRQVGLHPLWAITAMLIGGSLMGVGGTLLAVPLAAGVQVVLVHLFPKLKDGHGALLSEKYLSRSDDDSKLEADTVQADGQSLRALSEQAAEEAAAENSRKPASWAN